MSKLKPGKVAFIGCGFVGAASAFALKISYSEFRLDDRCRFMPEIMMILRMQPLL